MNEIRRSSTGDRSPSIPPAVEQLVAWSWRLLVVGAAGVALILVASRLRLVLLPLAGAVLLAAALTPPARWLTNRGLHPLAATWLTFICFLGTLAALGVAVLPPVVDEFGDLGPTLETGVEDLERWLSDGPVGLDPVTVDDLRARVGASARDAFTSDGVVLDGAVLAGEAIAGAVLTLAIAFFIVKDGERLQRWALHHVPTAHRRRARHVGATVWSTLSRYLAGAATLGLTEAVIIAIAMAATGSSVVAPVAVLTFVGAFFPFVGAVVAGVIAVLAALVSAGPGAAVIVAIVAIVVQQFDNELLAPVVYSRALRIHPLVVILAVATGAAVGGLIGAFLAVPLAAVTANAVAAASDIDAIDDGS